MPAAENSVRNQLIGTWELVSCTATNDEDPSDLVHTWTERAQGILIYSPDGYVSVMLQVPGETPFTGDALGRPFIAYGGAYSVDEEDGNKPILYHNMRHASLLKWLGDTQRRVVEFFEQDGKKQMSLSPERSVVVDGISRRSKLTWRRAEPNYEKRPSSSTS
jgi:Lipocalin-like domain